VIELEVALVFYAALFFTLLYVWKEHPLFGVLTFGCWFSLGLMWLVIVPMETAYAFAFLFQGIGVLFLIIVIIQYLQHLNVQKGYGEEDE